jgi:hypothetical protein
MSGSGRLEQKAALCARKSRLVLLPAWLVLLALLGAGVESPALATFNGETPPGGGGATGTGGGGGAGNGGGGGGGVVAPQAEGVPEMDPGAATAALALLLCGTLILVDRLRPRLRFGQ